MQSAPEKKRKVVNYHKDCTIQNAFLKTPCQSPKLRESTVLSTVEDVEII